ncbi:phosphoglycerate mutase-like protein [Tuber magnatum]|uniref:Phosphoglycerate mutase-like protein n=1 Tax=Tuber magnatum TaxID=42249 RepID=A0A317SVM5_9PEZI|nr:phosphoglycerate mutase-like protein [Tuber magnatum]
MRIKTTGEALIGEEKLICPTLLAYVYFSPRLRAKRTLELLGLYEKCPRLCERSAETDQLVEWDYGDYEGLTSPERRMRHRTNEALADRPWDIWRDGCVGGESPEDVERRCDALIKTIREQWHGPAMRGGNVPGDVVCVAHGHLLRAFAMRWVGKSISSNAVPLILEAGGVGILSYEHHSIGEPAILLGGSFVVKAQSPKDSESSPETQMQMQTKAATM